MKYLTLLLTSAIGLLATGLASAVTPADYTTTLSSNVEYSFPATVPAGNRCNFVLTGSFSGAAVTPGYISTAGAFTALGSAVTAAATLGPYVVPLGPSTGKGTPALSLSGGVSPAIRLEIVQLNPGTQPLNADSINTALGYSASATGGASTIPLFDSAGNLALGPLTSADTSLQSAGLLNIPAFKKTSWYDNTTGTEVAYQYMQPNHGGGAELFTYSPRFCYYADQFVQFGRPDAVTIRYPNGIYFNPLGGATAGDAVRESWPFQFWTSYYSGGTKYSPSIGFQVVPTSTTTADFNFYAGLTGEPNVDGKLASVSGATKILGIGNAGITLTKILTGTEQASAPAAPAADGFTIYAEDNGSGKTRLMVKFATGAAQQLAIQP